VGGDLIRQKLLAWSKLQNRKLPWRGTRDPYRIWVSEVMLQQTTVGAVRGRYEKFLVRFPDLPSLARAREDSVLAAWSGLGYYSRARNLRLAARRVLKEHAGRLPRDPRALARLPGFGEYTAAAVACLAFGAREPAAEANVTRVLSRLYAIEGWSGDRLHGRAVLGYCRELLASGPSGATIAALMDLGQLVCKPRRPNCGSCPLSDRCLARREGSPENYPVRREKPPAARVFLAAACARRGDRILLARRRDSLLEGLWEFPSAEGKTRRSALHRLATRIKKLGLRLETKAIGSARHTVVNRHLFAEVFEASPDGRSGTPDPGPSVRWFTPAQLDRAAVPTLTRKIARAAGLRGRAG
jgi:A/G-specific adenine glycosylase